MFPEHTQHLLAWLAVPVAVADSIGVLAAATPEPAQKAVSSKAQGLKGRLQRQRGAGDGVGWVDGVAGVVAGSLHTFRSMSGEGAGDQQSACVLALQVTYIQLYAGAAMLPKQTMQQDCASV